MFKIFRRSNNTASAPSAPSARFSWQNPGGTVQNLNKMILEGGAHVLVAGNTRSGKSTLLHGVMGDALKMYSPARCAFYLIDPKRIELRRYRELPHTIGYANTTAGAMALLEEVRGIMEERYKQMEGKQPGAETPKYDGCRIYVVIDELIPLVTGPEKNDFLRLLMLLLSQAGAANIWFIVGTQAPRRDVLPGKLMLYFTLIVGLSMASAVESRCALGVKGCESLPLHGRCLIKYGPEMMQSDVVNTDLRQVQELIDYWQGDACKVLSAA